MPKRQYTFTVDFYDVDGSIIETEKVIINIEAESHKVLLPVILEEVVKSYADDRLEDYDANRRHISCIELK